MATFTSTHRAGRRRHWCARAGRRWWRWWRSDRGCIRPPWRWRRIPPVPGQRPEPPPPDALPTHRHLDPPKDPVLDRPSVRPASARVWSKLSKAPRAVRYISGKATTMVAKIADHQVITSFTPKVSRTQEPKGAFGTQQDQQQPAHHRGRKHQRQRQHHIQHAFYKPGSRAM